MAVFLGDCHGVITVIDLDDPCVIDLIYLDNSDVMTPIEYRLNKVLKSKAWIFHPFNPMDR